MADFLAGSVACVTIHYSERQREIVKKEYKETEYSKKLRDPRWQKKRLEILQRDDFTCQSCFDSESTLHVHHCYYSKGNEPWNYPPTSLVTLCEKCHQTETECAFQEKNMLIEVLSIAGFLSSHFNDLGSTIYQGINSNKFNLLNGVCKDIFISALGWAVTIPEFRSFIEKSYLENLKNRREELKSEKEKKDG